MRCFVRAKIHGITVTDKSVEYHGSVSIGRDLLEAARIDPYERVEIVNLTNGQRWATYAIPAPEGEFTLNGGGARLGENGDRCVVMAFDFRAQFGPEPAQVVFCKTRAGKNVISEVTEYRASA